MLLWISLIPLYAITQESDKKCYTRAELEKISYTIISGKQCCSLLLPCDSLNKTYNLMILSYDSIIDLQANENRVYSTLVSKQDSTIKSLNTTTSNKDRTIKWIKTGWLTTTVILSLALVASIFY